MVFQRARNEAQKNLRTQQILDATAELFDSYHYWEITLAMIANKLEFSRINMYKYITNKDDIFIKLFARDMTIWVKDVLTVYNSSQTMDITTFSVLWSEILNRHQRYMKILSIMNTVIEKNVPAAKVEQYSAEVFQTFYQLTDILCRNFNFFTVDLAKEFLFIQKNFICGLYPLNNLPQAQQTGLKINAAYSTQANFIPSMTNFMTIILKGYESLYKKNR